MNTKSNKSSTQTAVQWGERLKKTLIKSPYDEAKALECIKGWAEACRTEKINVNRFTISYGQEGSPEDRFVEALPQALILLWAYDQSFSVVIPKVSSEEVLSKASAEQLKILIKAIWSEGVLVNNTGPDTDRFPPERVFHLATRLGIEIIALESLHQGANTKVRDPQGDHTPLMAAAREGHLKTVKALVDLGVDLNTKNQLGYTALMIAVAHGRQQVVDLLLEQGADVHRKNTQGQDALFIAAGAHHPPEIIQSILAHHQNVNTKTSEFKGTACHEAALRGRLDNLKCLVEAGAHLKLKDQFGSTPMLKAMDRGHQHVIDYLCEVINAQYEKKALERVLKKENKGIQNDPLNHSLKESLKKGDSLDDHGSSNSTLSSDQKDLKRAALGAVQKRRL